MTDESPTLQDVEDTARKALGAMGHTDTCPICGADLWKEVFWFDMRDKPYRNCPKCNKVVYE